MQKVWTRATLCLAMGLLAACGGIKRDAVLEDTLRLYGSLVRWNEIDKAVQFIDPAYLEAHPIKAVDVERYKHIQVAAYRDSQPVLGEDGKIRISVQIEYINVHTQSPKSLIDNQVWHYDEEKKRWLNETGLPDLSKAR